MKSSALVVLVSTSMALQPTLRRLAARDYSGAVAALNTLQSNAATVASIRQHGRFDQDAAVPQMLGYLARTGITPRDLDALNVVHIAGTKGKGSTAAMTASILNKYTAYGGGRGTAVAPRKVGLYTSPHLRFVRERIQIAGVPLSERIFAHYFWDVWDRLGASGAGDRPMYFRFLTILALHVFLREGVDSAIVECGIGGEYDSTNVFERPSVTAITTLGIDHVPLLGTTLPEIAWHKSGIFKRGTPALTMKQHSDAFHVLDKRAADVGEGLVIAHGRGCIIKAGVRLPLEGDFQLDNAKLAVAVAAKHLQRLGWQNIPSLDKLQTEPLPRAFVAGLESVQWAGRADVRHEKKSRTTWLLDGAHTAESIEVSAAWYVRKCLEQQGQKETPSTRTLIFNQQTRDADALLITLYKAIHGTLGHRHFERVIFTTNITYANEGYAPDLKSLHDTKEYGDLKVQRDLRETWQVLEPETEVHVAGSIEQAIGIARTRNNGTNIAGVAGQTVLVIGSLHLVGGAIEILEAGNKSA